MKVLMKGFFDLVGETITKKFKGLFDIVEDNIAPQIINVDSTTNSFYGILKDNNVVISKAKLTFINEKNVVCDYCYSNELGEYFAFLKNGKYKLKISGTAYNTEINDLIVDNSLSTPKYSFVKNGVIKSKKKDYILFSNEDKLYVQGIVLDENNRPLSNAEIIITRNKNVVVYSVTDNFGKYKFLLAEGIYDVRFRAEDKPVKIFNNFNFSKEIGFVDKLKESNLFNRGDLLWICK